MPIFYKYLSYIDEKTFSNPTVRLSVPMHLNDPFESSICNTICEDIKFNYDQENKANIGRRIFNIIIRSQVNQYGIVSLSETSRNLLMWAHYADEHRGICIGYKDDFLDSMEKPIDTNHGGHFKPTRVMYDTIRYYKESDNKKGLPEPSELCFKILTNKSDDWIYEKEHRCIVPLFWADYIKYSGKLPRHIARAIDIYSNEININIENKNEYYFDNLDNDELISITDEFSLDKKSIFIKKIDPSKIERIYFGCRYPKDKLIEHVNELSKPDHCLNHVKLYKYELDPIRFELNEIPLKQISN
ncbi:DUF2971 domain-containing protein [Aeromonas veronii]